MNKTRKLFTLLLTVIALSAICLSMVGCSASFTVSFETNGGSSIEAVTVEAQGDAGAEYVLPATTKSGFEFAGWYDNAGLTGTVYSAGTKITLNDNRTFYAAWTALYTVTLNADGGSLSTTSVQLKEGENVYEAVKDLVPVKAGCQFGAWFNGSTELSKNTRMGKAAMTLTARYKVPYTVEIYEKATDGSGYALAETTKGYEYVGVNYVSEVTRDGFREVDNAERKTSVVISANASENVLKHFFDREVYNLTFNANYPAGAPENVSVTIAYGEETDAPYDYFTYDGYYLLGWATTPSGSVAYYTRFIESNLYNGNGETFTADKISVSRNTTLYAVWVRGYVDMFGGNDYIYRFENSSDVYLERGGVYFVGGYSATRNVFTFNQNDKTLRGKLNPDGSFCYEAAEDRGEAFAYSAVNGLDVSRKLFFERYNEITYSVTGENGQTATSEGTYTPGDSDDFIASFTSGPMSGKVVSFKMSTMTSEGTEISVFTFKNDEESDLGELVRYAVYKGRSGVGYTYYIYYQLTFSGYGTATVKGVEEDTTYYTEYDEENDLYVLYTRNATTGELQVYEKIVVAKEPVISGVNGYWAYYDELDNEFSSDSGATLLLDGLYNAVYTDENGVAHKGVYARERASAISGTIINFFGDDGTERKILADVVTTTVEVGGIDENGNPNVEEKTEYLFYEKSSSYGEYFYNNSASTYMAPLFVIEDGKADVYIYSGETYTKAISGTYEEKGKGVYVLTVTDYYLDTASAIVGEATGELNDVVKITFGVGSHPSLGYPVNYWYAYTDKNGVEQTLFATYNGDDGVLTIVGAFALLEVGSDVFVGSYEKSGEYISATFDMNAFDQLVIFKTADDGTYLTLKELPATENLFDNNNSNDADGSIAFDGFGGATYTDKDGNVYEGTVTETDDETEGLTVYEFASETLTFKFVRQALSNGASLVLRYNEAFSGDFYSADGVLTLDGFGVLATFNDADGSDYSGRYVLVTDDEKTYVVISLEDGKTLYVDFASDKTFTARGFEYGTYVYFNNRYASGTFVHLDGYGKAEVYTLEGDERSYLDENATYVVDGDVYTLTYKNGAENVTVNAKLSTFDYNGNTYRTFVIEHEEVVYRYVNDGDWSVLVLDAFGKGEKYGADGVKQTGTYEIVSENLLYFLLEDGSDAFLYEYDAKVGFARTFDFPLRAYFTGTLESLLFTKYGRALFGGEQIYYYNIENDKVFIYHRDTESDQANAYGYVKEEFGTFDTEVIYNGVKYYENDGYGIELKRNEDGKNKYPVLISSEDENKYPLNELKFAPTGRAEFVVTATTNINGTNYNATVTREKRNDEYVTYVTVGTYNFYFNANYDGKNNTYDVYKMERRVVFRSYTYVYYARMYAMYGMNLPDTFGTTSYVIEYDEEGTAGDGFISTNFLADSNMYYSDGTLISLDGLEYVYDSASGVYSVAFEGADGYDYIYRFSVTTLYNVNVYRVVGMTRVQSFEDGDYTLRAERLIASDSGNAGSFYALELYDNGKLAQRTVGGYVNEQYYYISRLIENGEILRSTYYIFDISEEECEASVKPISGVTVTKNEMTVYYSADGENYVEVTDSNEILVFPLNGGLYIPKASEYDPSEERFIVTLSNDAKYIVDLDGRNITVERLETASYADDAIPENAGEYTLTVKLGNDLDDLTFTLKEGQNVAKVLSGVEVDERFGRWETADGALVDGDYLMPAQNLTVTAVYRSGYSVNVYVESLNGGYELLKTINGYAYVGEEFSPEVTLKGFTRVYNEQEISTRTISETENENTYALYFERASYKLTYVSNAASYTGANNETYSVYIPNGKSMPILDKMFELEGYYLAGWAFTPDGEMVYTVNYAANYAENRAHTLTPDPEISIDKDTALYAVWIKGYTDIFASNDKDYIYLLSDDAEVVYLERGGIFFVGNYDRETKAFSFFRGETLVYEGALVDGGYYLIEAEHAKTYSLYENGKLDKSVTLTIDTANKATITENDETTQGVVTMEGGYYVFTDFEGVQKVFILKTTTVDGTDEAVFMIRNETEYAYGRLVRFGITSEGSIGTYQYYQLRMDGFETAVYYGANGNYAYAYRYDEESETYLLYTSDGELSAHVKLLRYNGVDGYFYLNVDMAHAYAYGSYVVEFDGMHTAKIINGETTTERNYSYRSSEIGDYVVTIFNGKTTLTLRLASATVDGETTYTAESVSSDYAEYFYNDGETISKEVVMTLSGSNIAFYALVDGKYVLAADGTYQQRVVGNYVANVINTYLEEAKFAGLDLNVMKNIIFDYDTELGEEYNFFIYNVTDSSFNKTDYTSVYTNDQTGETLTLVAGYAVVTAGNNKITATYVMDNGICVVTINSRNYYLSLDDETGAFAYAMGKPYEAQVFYGYKASEDKFAFDGKGGATYVRNGETLKGTVSAANSTSNGLTVYTFTQTVEEGEQALTFNYVLLYDDHIFTEENALDIECSKGSLSVNGYGVAATYTDVDGAKHTGVLTVLDETFLITVSKTEKYCLDLTEDGFTVKGSEYDTYIVVVNWEAKGYVRLDGYGKAVYTNVYTGSEEEMTYSVIDEYIIVEYGENEHTFEMTTMNGLPALVRIDIYQGYAGTYLNSENWSVIDLDLKGNATYYDADGKAYEGIYLVLDDELLFTDFDDTVTFTFTAKDHEFTYLYPVTSYYTEEKDYEVLIANGELIYFVSKEKGSLKLDLVVFDDETQTYSVKGVNGEEYSVKIENGKAVVEKIK